MVQHRTVVLQARAVEGSFGRELQFVKPDNRAFAAAVEALWNEGRRFFVLHGTAREVDALAQHLRALYPALEENEAESTGARRADTAYLYPGLDGEALADVLMGHVDDRQVAIIAPRGERHYSRMPLFLISIPKAGTHLLYELARALGYRDGIICPDLPSSGYWYCVEYSNSHTRATDFLIDTTRRAPFGNKHHPLFRSPALFIYRNPRDILVSEASWFHKSANSPLAGYLCDLSDEERLVRLIDDPWLLGTIRDRVGSFIPWLSFPNVIPLSFEEIVGDKGGGSDAVQLDLIWSIQLKLQSDGNPEDIARKVFNPDSPTFTEGRIGGWRRRATPEAKEHFSRLPADFLRIYGYGQDAGEDAPPIPSRAKEFRNRRLCFTDADFTGTPILVETSYLEHNIVRLGPHFYGVPQAAGRVSLQRLDQERIWGLVVGKSLASVKTAVLRKSVLVPEVIWKLWSALGRLLRRERP